MGPKRLFFFPLRFFIRKEGFKLGAFKRSVNLERKF